MAPTPDSIERFNQYYCLNMPRLREEVEGEDGLRGVAVPAQQTDIAHLRFGLQEIYTFLCCPASHSAENRLHPFDYPNRV